ncbi:flagellar biosynthesis regulator FlaF [uncultured Marivita sp.]|nr:flagellar biosynthesis regulator FlaF [uncultured Marivita sp.]
MLNPDVYQSYRTTPIKSIKDTEIEIVLRTTRRLKEHAETRQADYAGFVAALSSNQKLWTMFAVDVANANNGLTTDLRAQIFYLFEFVQTYSRRVLIEDVSIAPLIETNLAMLRGLTAIRPSQ